MTYSKVDPARFQIAGAAGTALPTPTKKRKKCNNFVKGPIPLGWLHAAGGLPGHTLHVGLMLWYERGFTNRLTVDLSLSHLAESFGIDRATAHRGLDALEHAGLVQVERRPGRRPRVTILLVGSDEETGSDAGSEAK